MTLSIRKYILGAIMFKLTLVLILFGLLSYRPLYEGQRANKPNDLVSIFYNQDGNNYQDICIGGYQKKYITEPREVLMYMAFLPALPLLICSIEWYPASIDMVWYSGIIINFLFWILLVLSLKYYLDKYYTRQSQKLYILFFFFLFPTSFFFQLNYTEVVFLPLSLFIWRMIDDGKVRASSLIGFLLGFVRITAIPFGFLMWVKYSINSIVLYQQKKLFDRTKYILDSLSFFLYSFGSLLTFAFFKYEYGNFNLFFESQKIYYGRETTFATFIKTILDVFGLSSLHWIEKYRTFYWDYFDFSKQIINTGFTFYDRTFRQINLYTLPFVFAIVASLLLWKKNRKFELFYSWVMWLVPMISDSNSVNRYILQSFPFIFVVAESCFDIKYLRIPVLIMVTLLYFLYFILHAYGFWIA
jgi:hypothetical protein